MADKDTKNLEVPKPEAPISEAEEARQKEGLQGLADQLRIFGGEPRFVVPK